MFDVACIGILVADVIAKPILKMPEKGLLERIDEISLHNGGCAMTAAVNLSKIGLRVALLGKVGEDYFGTYLKNTLIESQVNIDGIVTDPLNQTSASVVLSDLGGERTFLHCVGANGTFSKEDINWEVIEKSKYVFFAGTMLMDTFDGEHCAAVLRKCKEMGKITVLDTAWDSKNRWMKVLEPCLPYTDIFLPSIDEAMKLSGERDPKKITDVFFEKGVKKTAIKLGKEGCFIRENKEDDGIMISTYPVKVVDTTGAGDSFCSGFITGLVKGYSFSDCGRLGNAVGSLCVSAIGATTGIKPYEEILAFMEEVELK